MVKGGKREGAGRPAGSLSKKTIMRHRVEAKVNQLILERAEELTQLLLDLATGKHSKDKPDMRAIESLLDRALGRATQKTAFVDADGETLPLARAQEITEKYAKLPNLPRHKPRPGETIASGGESSSE